MLKKKKLCLVIPSLQSGGMERVMSELASCFCQKNELELHLIIYGNRINIFYTLPDNIVIHKPDLKFNKQLRLFSAVGRLLFLRKAVVNIKPDSILSFGEYWNSFVLLSLLGLKYPVFVSDRCRPDKNLGIIHNSLRRLLYPRARGIIAQTTMAKTFLHNQFKHNNIQIIGNPIRQAKELDHHIIKENIVLTVSRLIKSKNHDKLIEMFIKINKPGWKLIIVGDNALNQDIKSELSMLITKLNAEDKVILAGSQTNVEQYYRKSKIFAFTSDSEGFPNVIGEAQSFGLPVIAFDCIAGPSDMIIDNINGFLVPLYNYNLFKQKLSLLMDNPELRDQFGTKAQKSIQKFSSDTIANKFYNFVLGN